MDVLTSETCWALNSEIIKQVTSSWSLFIQLQIELFDWEAYLVSQSFVVPLLTVEQSSVQLDQDASKLPSFVAYITLLLFSVCLVRQQTDQNSGCTYSGADLVLGRHVQRKIECRWIVQWVQITR